MPDVVMPRLSDSMEEGTILKWLKSDGDEVARGDEIVEIETDKATMTYEADSAGALRIVAQEGETLPIGAVIAQIGEGGSADGTAPAEATAPAAAPAPAEAESPGDAAAATAAQAPADAPAPPAQAPAAAPAPAKKS